MPTHGERKILPYTQAQMFDLVADIERYPEFLPWCVACRIRKREAAGASDGISDGISDGARDETGEIIWGDLMVGFKVFRETFSSKVTLYGPD
ncbi:MAG: hypothetical protein HOM62_07095, partial [Rhodospirillaceae bacterium]|nr:hypothetical protein [Rhodospirillaceae bacterium]